MTLLRMVGCRKFLILCLLVVCTALSAQTTRDNIISFPEEGFVLGQIRDTIPPVKKTFIFTNTDFRPLVITSVYTTCNCLSEEHISSIINPGEQGWISLTFDPSNYTGNINVKALVYTSLTGKNAAAVLPLTGEVLISDQWWYLSKSMGSLKLKRKVVDMDEVGMAGKREARVLCANTGSTPLRLSAALIPDFAGFRTEPQVIQPGQEADLVITVDASELASLADRTKDVEFEFLVEGLGKIRPSERIMKVRILPTAE